MGWEDGKGLGATNQGMTDPIMLKSKDDQKVFFLFQWNQCNKANNFQGHKCSIKPKDKQQYC